MWLYKIVQQPLAVTHLENVLVEFYRHRMNEYVTQCVYSIGGEHRKNAKKLISEQRCNIVKYVGVEIYECSLPV